ncbi:MAG: hypothetical protein PHY34_02680 [Patescibacteria group bacterium]|nr:hypothetical protein [Patescibacteria group bacterium]MDD5715452.1 hypothetical protein [Patescibacteria group bacterium]
MAKKIDTNTRFYIDIDIETKKIMGWGCGSRYELEQELANPDHRRIFITKGQYNKLKK